MRAICLLLASVFILGKAEGVEAGVRLHYLPNVPVEQSSHIQLTFNDLLPGLKLEGHAAQVITAMITLLSDQPDMPVTHLPLDLLFVLKKVQVDLQANGAKIGFNSDDPNSSLPLAQTSKLIDHPVKLHIDEHLSFDSDAPEFQKMLAELPALQEMHLENFLMEWFQHLFALAGKDLAAGKTYDVQANAGGNSPPSYHYTVTSISDQDIQADFKGELDPKGMKLINNMSMDGTKQNGVELTLSGVVQGNVKWNRRNALIYKLNSEHRYKGALKVGESSWGLSLTLKHQLDSVQPKTGN